MILQCNNYTYVNEIRKPLGLHTYHISMQRRLKKSTTGRILKSLGCLHTKSMDVGKGPDNKLSSNPSGYVSIGKGLDHKLTSNPAGYVSMGIY